MYYAELLHPSGGQLLVLYVDFQWDAVSLRIVTSKREITCPLVASCASAEKLAERFDDDPFAIHHAIVHQADAGGEKPLVLEPEEHAGRIAVSLVLRDGTVMSPIEVVQYHE